MSIGDIMLVFLAIVIAAFIEEVKGVRRDPITPRKWGED